MRRDFAAAEVILRHPLQVSLERQVAAFRGLLEASSDLVERCPDRPLSVLATAFVASELKRQGRLMPEQAQQDLENIVRHSLQQLQASPAKTLTPNIHTPTSRSVRP